MATKGFIADGFWLCLRPSLTYSSSIGARLPPLWKREFGTSPSNPSGQRSLHHDGNSIDASTGRPPRSPEGSTRGEKASRSGTLRAKQTKSSLKKIIPRRNKTPQDLEGLANSNLENMLQEVVTGRPSHDGAFRIAKELIVHRNVEPQARHYRAMILANAHSIHGSAPQVEKLLNEMELNGIVTDSGTLHAALKVLAIHPDHLLRTEVMRKLRDRWLPLSPAGWHNVVTGYIRERQYEMALETFERMELQNIPIHDWLFRLLVYNLLDAGEFDEVLRLIRSRVEAGHSIAPNLWFLALDLASSSLHVDLTTYIWNEQVDLGYINPSHGVCDNVLIIAARTGNTKLATSVLGLLSQRNADFKSSDYEAVTEAYITVGDIDSALRIICIMGRSVGGAHESSVRSILSHWVTTDANPRDIWATLKRLKEEEKLEIPFAAANGVIELCAIQNDTKISFELYREFHTVCTSGVETSTFNHLIDLCRRTRDLELGSFLIQDMIRMKLLPERKTYENLILFCLDGGYYDNAYKYLLEMNGSGFGLTQSVKDYIYKKCNGLTDSNALALKNHSAVSGPVSRRIRWG